MQGDELRALRKAAGLTQGELAERLGLTPTFVGMMERGDKSIEPRTALATRFTIRDKFLVSGRMTDGRYWVIRSTVRSTGPLTIHGTTIGYGGFRSRGDAYRWCAALQKSSSPRPTREKQRDDARAVAEAS